MNNDTSVEHSVIREVDEVSDIVQTLLRGKKYVLIVGLPKDSLFALVTVTPRDGNLKNGVEVAVLSNITEHRVVAKLFQEMGHDIAAKGSNRVVVVEDGWDGKIDVDAEGIRPCQE